MDLRHLDDAGLPEQRLAVVVTTGEIGGVRSSRTRAFIRHAALPDDQRLPDTQCASPALKQPARVVHALDIGEDRPRFRIIEQRVDELYGSDIRLVTSGDDGTEADARTCARERETDAETAALRHQRKRAALELRRAGHAAKGGIDIAMNVRDPEAIRSDDAHVGCPRDREQAFLPLDALRTALAETAGLRTTANGTRFLAHDSMTGITPRAVSQYPPRRFLLRSHPPRDSSACPHRSDTADSRDIRGR